METITPTKSQQRLIERTAQLLANGVDEQDFAIYLDLLETKAAHIALKERLSNAVAGLGVVTPIKRPYVRKPKQESLIEKSGVAAASEALKEQAPQLTDGEKAVVKRVTRQSNRKKETVEEIKGNIEELSIDL